MDPLRLIHPTFFRCLARSRIALGSWRRMPGEPHGYCLYRHAHRKDDLTYPDCSPGPRGHSRVPFGHGNPLGVDKKVILDIPSPLNSSSPRRRGPSVVRKRRWIPAVAGMRGWPRATTWYTHDRSVRTAHEFYRSPTHRTNVAIVRHQTRHLRCRQSRVRGAHPTFTHASVGNHHANCSISALASIKSFVSKPSVNQS